MAYPTSNNRVHSGLQGQMRNRLFAEHHDRLVGGSEYHRQYTDWTCGPSSVRTVLSAYGVDVTETLLARILATTSDDGTDGDRIEQLFVKLGFDTRQESGVENSVENLAEAIKHGWSVIMLVTNKYDTPHFVVAKSVDAKWVTVVDPWFGPDYTYQTDQFGENVWFTDSEDGDRYPRWMLAVKHADPSPERISELLNNLDS